MKLNAHKTTRTHDLADVAAYVDSCIDTHEVPEPQALIDSVIDTIDSKDTLHAQLIAALILDWEPIRAAGLKLAQTYGTSSNEVKALRTAVQRAGKAAAAAYDVEGVALELLTIQFKGKRGQAPDSCDVVTRKQRNKQPANDGAGAGEGEAESSGTEAGVTPEKQAEVFSVLSDREAFDILLARVGAGQINDWLAEAIEQSADAAVAEAMKGHKPTSHARH